ncbi:hypothetical protein PPSIR1_02376 [Plesiocystis pacifica SIR-1]|uniref:PTS EIIA type-4 domain-containing protein n=1 Tax=Plesiocystis pacifica SIR-1 TaxID=391625 RepID=A6G439_9BACT|nr:hypothetical protein [Plesiocystis pacifica]EDM79362.1 hypothetical protein PPSIR1_02376 [Plesiocystis pacifica SIR-1]
MPIDGCTTAPSPPPAASDSDPNGDAVRPRCGVVIIGHGTSATALLAAARSLLPVDGLDDAVAIDAGAGVTPALKARVCEVMGEVDIGGGILLVADLMGSSPCTCGVQQSVGHGFALVTGLNLAVLTKLGLLDRRQAPRALAEQCAESVKRSIVVKAHD